MENHPEIAVVIPIYQSEPDEYEKISLLQCFRILSRYRIIFLTYRSLDISRYIELSQSSTQQSPETVYFNKRNFNGIRNYNRLLVSLRFYIRFIRYKYILIYQLDAFVFRDELQEWAGKNYCYIGAPWLSDWKNAKEQDAVLGVGNGGLSLRQVKCYIRALLTFSFIESPETLRKRIFKRKISFARQWLSYLSNLTIKNNTFFLFNNYSSNEDGYWGLLIKSKFRWFRVATPAEAIKFSFEVQPRRFYHENHLRLPFGCHAWTKYDFSFWKTHIESFGYKL